MDVYISCWTVEPVIPILWIEKQVGSPDLQKFKPLIPSLLLFLSQGVRTLQACAPVTSLSRALLPRRPPPPYHMSAWETEESLTRGLSAAL